ncbi:MAG: agmatinase [candidate division Zixibacteria bacterium]|nr:agmatinase [candidate division Zixibacteria bacterium]
MEILTKTFLGIKQPDYKTAQAVILPIGYEETASYLKGTIDAPTSIIEASYQLELYDIETDSQPHLEGIYTAPPISLRAISPEEAIKRTYTETQSVLKASKLPVLIGGEHSLSLGAVKAGVEVYSDLSVLQIDAHADLRDSYEGTEYSHACVMKRVSEMVPYIGVGIRSVAPDESEIFKRKRKAKEIFTVADFRQLENFEAIVEKLSDNVYITIDADGFDPSLIPGVGTPEPDGLTFDELNRMLGEVIATKNIVGFDFMELRPMKGDVRSEFTAAKIVYKVLAKIFRIGL